MNKKGMTLVEIIVAISLISVVMIFLFQVLFTVINGNKRNNTKSKTLISKAIVMKAVEHDLDTFGLSDNSGVVDCSNKIENYLTIDSGSINQIIPASAISEDYYCVKLTYNEDNVKNNEGYLLFYQNNDKGFLAYKRGKGNVLETQIVREIDAIPKTDSLSDLIKKAEESDLYSLKINIPIIATDGNNYDLALNYIDGGTLNNPLPDYNPVNFEIDSWATIASYVKANKESTASVYAVGSEKKVTIDGTDYKVRIANNSNYDCTLDSKTACGFVVEFVDIVEKRAMNLTDTNKEGWNSSNIKLYLNGEFLTKLESSIGRNVIVPTAIISGHGVTAGEENFKSNDDKLYLLSTGEIYSNCFTIDCGDTASLISVTRQLDYYAQNNVTTENGMLAVKKYNGVNSIWWLRSARSNSNNSFKAVTTKGNTTSISAIESNGVSPAFRVA